MPRLFRWLASMASGLALWACYPPLDAGWLVWVALIPLLWVLWGGEPMTAKARFGYAYLTGVVFFFLNLKWLRHVHPAGLLPSFFLALYVGLWGAFVAALGRPRQGNIFNESMRLASVSAAWTGLEWLRGIVFPGFGWNGLGVALHRWPDCAAEAEWIGVTGLSFWIVLFQAAFVFLAMAIAGPGAATGRLRATAPALVILLLVVALYGAPTWWLARESARGGMVLDTDVQIALVQPNVAQEVKSSPENFDPIAKSLARLTTQALERTPAPSMIVWPESALPSIIDDPKVWDFLDATIKRGDFALVLGIDEQLMDRMYNSVAVIQGTLESTRLHAKVQLVPFGEYLPVRGILGKFETISSQLPGDFDAGESTEPIPLEAIGIEMIPLVCFEDTIGRVARKFVRPGRQIMVNVTNDAWFKDSEEAEQHLANAVFRCLELRRPMIRAANTGVTAVIDAQGKVTHRFPRLEEGVLSATVEVADTGLAKTIYARYGDRFSQGLLIWAAAVLLSSQLRKRLRS